VYFTLTIESALEHTDQLETGIFDDKGRPRYFKGSPEWCDASGVSYPTAMGVAVGLKYVYGRRYKKEDLLKHPHLRFGKFEAEPKMGPARFRPEGEGGANAVDIAGSEECAAALWRALCFGARQFAVESDLPVNVARVIRTASQSQHPPLDETNCDDPFSARERASHCAWIFGPMVGKPKTFSSPFKLWKVADAGQPPEKPSVDDVRAVYKAAARKVTRHETSHQNQIAIDILADHDLLEPVGANNSEDVVVFQVNQRKRVSWGAV
jgi:hypothetical protein